MKANERMNATNDICRKWLGKIGFTDFKLFAHIIGKKDYELDGAFFDGLAFKGTEIYFMQFKTNQSPPKKSNIIKLYEKIEKSKNCRCIWVSYNTKQHELVLWSTKFPNGTLINKENVKENI